MTKAPPAFLNLYIYLSEVNLSDLNCQLWIHKQYFSIPCKITGFVPWHTGQWLEKDFGVTSWEGQRKKGKKICASLEIPEGSMQYN